MDMNLKSKGATLIEMIISIGLLSIVTLLLTHNLYQQVQTYMHLNDRYFDIIELKNATEVYLRNQDHYQSQRGNRITVSKEDSFYDGSIYIIHIENRERDEMMSIEVFSFRHKE